MDTYVEWQRHYSNLNEEETPAGPLGVIATVTVDDAKLYSASELDTDEVKPAILTDFSIHF